MCATRLFLALVISFLLLAASPVVAADDPATPPLSASQQEPQIADALSQWEAASRDVVPPSTEDEHVAYMVHKAKSSGHEIAVALEFQNPVRVDELQTKYRWKHVEKTEGNILLSAEPVEAVEQLFYRGFELQLDSETNLPTAIRFIDRNGKVKVDSLKLTVRTRKVEDDSEIQLTSAESTAPGPAMRVASKSPESNKQDDASKQTEPPEVSPELHALLTNWKKASTSYRTLDAEFARRVYDSTFQVEKVSRGRLYFEAPNKGRVDFGAIQVKNAQSERIDLKTGRRYGLESDSPETWVWTGKYVMQFNPGDKSVAYSAISNGWGTMIPGPQAILPFVLDCMAGEYHLQIVKHDDLGVWVSAQPMAESKASCKVQETIMILDPDTYLTKHIKYVIPGGNLETVYSFSSWKVNEPFADKDRPLQPDLTGYTGAPKLDVEVDEPVIAPKPLAR